MMRKLTIVEINYHYHPEFDSPAPAIALHTPSNLLWHFVPDHCHVVLIKHINYEGELKKGNVEYKFLRGTDRFFEVPKTTHQVAAMEVPDIVLVQGLIFPWQVRYLRRKLPRHCRIIAQHQGEVPFRRKKIFQKMADKMIDGYLFTSRENAEEWIQAGVILDRKKIFEINPSSSTISKKEKALSKEKTGMDGRVNFLWVGRLIGLKDPRTTLEGFESYFRENPKDKLYMIFGDETLRSEIESRIRETEPLKNSVVLVGKKPHEELAYWYSGADYFVSSSTREGGSFALTEAMSCGCIPIVSSIPSAMKAIDSGKAGYFFETGHAENLAHVLLNLDHAEISKMSGRVLEHYQWEMSPHALARRMLEICDEVISGKRVSDPENG